MSGFTKGPWEHSHREGTDGMYRTEVFTADGAVICTVDWYPMPQDENGVIGTYRDANARLIAQAPALLEALEASDSLIVKAQSILAEYIVPNSGISDHEVIGSLLGLLDGPLQRRIQTQTKTILAAAKGEST